MCFIDNAVYINQKIRVLLGLGVLYGMTMGGMTSMLTNIDARRATFVHRYRAFENAVVGCLLVVEFAFIVF